jgi:DNA repair protein RadC
MHLKELAVNERPREKLRRWGPRILADRELIALILGNGCQGTDVLELCDSLLKAAKGLQGLRRTPLSLLSRFPGMGEAKAARLCASFELAARLMSPRPDSRKPISSPRQAHQAIALELEGKDVEELWVMILDSKNAPLNKILVSRGGLNFAAAHPREVFRECILQNGCSIIMAHNHPSGNPQPSANDLRLTALLVKSGRLLGIGVLDHIIVGGGNYVSLKERGEMGGGEMS